MHRFSALLAASILSFPAGAIEAPAGCSWLCGAWTLDATRGDAIEPLVDAALLKVKEPGPRRIARAPRDAGLAEAPPAEPGAEAESMSPEKAELRKKLLDDLAPEAALNVDAEGSAVLLHNASGSLRHLYPGEPHTRVTSRGSTTITTEWKKDTLVVREDLAGTRKVSETFSLLADGNLLLTRVVERSGIKPLTGRAIYRRNQTQALESGALEPTQNNAP
jgi:hypothetical protein